jgi:hypothetical protein
MSSWLRFDFSSSKLDGWREELQAKASRLHEVLFAKVQALTFQLQSKVVAKLSGEVLHRRTGILAGSVHTTATSDGAIIRGTVSAAGPPATYGRFHEYGISRAWEIRATRAKALAFQLGVKENARTIFAKSVVHPLLPQKSFMRSTLQESEQEIRDALAQAVADVLIGKNNKR